MHIFFASRPSVEDEVLTSMLCSLGSRLRDSLFLNTLTLLLGFTKLDLQAAVTICSCRAQWKFLQQLDAEGKLPAYNPPPRPELLSEGSVDFSQTAESLPLVQVHDLSVKGSVYARYWLMGVDWLGTHCPMSAQRGLLLDTGV